MMFTLLKFSVKLILFAVKREKLMYIVPIQHTKQASMHRHGVKNDCDARTEVLTM